MSDNKKYYYIKLKDHYFEQDNIKILEAQENGYIYSLIILKLYVKSAKYEGKLMMTDKIPYDPDKLSILAKVLNHDVAHIKDALGYAIDLDLISIMDSGDIWMTEIQNMIGHSSTEADRKRKYRKKLEDNSKGQKSHLLEDKSPEWDKYPPEKEIELDIESELEREKALSPPLKNKESIKPPSRDYTSEYEKLRKQWNNLPLPQSRQLAVNISNWGEVMNCMSLYNFDEIQASIINYSKIKDFKNAVRYTTFVNYLIRGVEKYADSSLPFETFKETEEERLKRYTKEAFEKELANDNR